MAFVLSHAPLSVSRCRQLDNEGRGVGYAALRCCLSPSLGLRPPPTPYLYRRARRRELALRVNANCELRVPPAGTCALLFSLAHDWPAPAWLSGDTAVSSLEA